MSQVGVHRRSRRHCGRRRVRTDSAVACVGERAEGAGERESREKLSRRSGRHRSRRRANQLRSNRVDHRYYIRPGELVHPLGCCEELSPVVVAVVKKNRRVDAKKYVDAVPVAGASSDQSVA